MKYIAELRIVIAETNESFMFQISGDILNEISNTHSSKLDNILKNTLREYMKTTKNNNKELLHG